MIDNFEEIFYKHICWFVYLSDGMVFNLSPFIMINIKNLKILK